MRTFLELIIIGAVLWVAWQKFGPPVTPLSSTGASATGPGLVAGSLESGGQNSAPKSSSCGCGG